MARNSKKGPAAVTAILFLPVIFLTAIISSLSPKTSTFYGEIPSNISTEVTEKRQNLPIRHQIEIPLNCSIKNESQTCPATYPEIEYPTDENPSPKPACPDYFRWIHEDLRPWKETGISREMLERAKATAHFRLLILKGKVYVEKYKKSIQTRDLFTIWGILQLLRRYPGKLPDLEMMFDCDDRPVIAAKDYRGENRTKAPPLFRYCGDRWSLDVVFPDWSFWGWAEINIRPWEYLLEELKEGNKRSKWIEREPFAYWKGNPFVAETRRDLLKCNLTEKEDWNARLFIQNWIMESQQGFKQSELGSQCSYRYKIYIEGYAWSVSEKYILACDSVTLMVKPYFYDFFSRSLKPLVHYWPIRDRDKCRSIKFAVDWGNRHQQKAQEMGKAASEFIQKDLKMDFIYDYMFHLLNSYAKLLRFEPKIPEGAMEVCSETMACIADKQEKRFMMDSLVKGPSLETPCTLPPPHEAQVLSAIYRRNLNVIRQVEKWENKYWETFRNQQ